MYECISSIILNLFLFVLLVPFVMKTFDRPLHLWITCLFVMLKHFHWIEGIQLYCFCLMFFRIVICIKEKSLFNAGDDTRYHCYRQIHVKILKGETSIYLISDLTEDLKLYITLYVLV